VSFRYFGGIDFSGAREPLPNLWTAVGEERGGKLHILWLQPHPFREDLRSYVATGWRRTGGVDEQDRIVWGADFPFGIPATAGAQITAERRLSWSGVAGWIADRPADEVKDALPQFGKVGRGTDTGGALAPFDLRLYRQTVEGIRWLHALRDEADVSILPVAPRDGAPTTLIEVYPSGASKEIGMKGGRLPSRPGEVRARPAALRTFMTFDHPSLEAAACTLEDARDACMACLVAWLCRDDLDQPARLGRVGAETLALEGWIYRPPAALAG
jgi:hypothetical protein